MSHFLKRIWREDEGVLTFEWVLLVTLLTIGVVSGIAGARDAVIDELADVAEAIVCIDQSFSLAPNCFGLGGFECLDEMPEFTRCERTDAPVGQT